MSILSTDNHRGKISRPSREQIRERRWLQRRAISNFSRFDNNSRGTAEDLEAGVFSRGGTAKSLFHSRTSGKSETVQTFPKSRFRHDFSQVPGRDFDRDVGTYPVVSQEPTPNSGQGATVQAIQQKAKGSMIAPNSPDISPAASAPVGIIQRYAFIKRIQVRKNKKGLTAEMKAMVSDNLVRNYKNLQEFKDHAAKKTDYLGNLVGTSKAGTWLRFSPTGINLLGENHTLVRLQDVIPSVGSKSFIYEPFSSDAIKKGSHLEAAYEKETKDRFKAMGVAKVKDKRKLGAESLFPKMGYALTLAIPYFEKKQPISDLTSGAYVGKPIQRYLRIAWAHSKDNVAIVKAKKAAKEKVPAKMENLAKTHEAVKGKLDKFIAALPVLGYIGDELVKKKNANLFKPLAEFSKAFTDAMVEMAATEKSSRLKPAERKKLLAAKSTKLADKETLFSNWRDYHFEDTVKAAAKGGVRYAGMGAAHLDHLKKVGLPPNSHPYEMDAKDLDKFEKLTNKLAKRAKKP